MYDSEVYANKIIAEASNIKGGDNPTFTLEDFYYMYKQFNKNSSGEYIVPEIITQMYLEMANAYIKESRWHSSWRVGMSLFIAHFCTIYLEGIADPDSGAAAILKAGQTRGLETSVSVGDVSVSTDYSTIVSDIDGWAGWKSTIYGVQLITLARMLGKAGMCVQ